MATVRHEIAEHDVVALRQAVGDWPAGTRGTAVSIYENAILVELPKLPGLEPLDLLVPLRATELEVTWRTADHRASGVEA